MLDEIHPEFEVDDGGMLVWVTSIEISSGRRAGTNNEDIVKDLRQVCPPLYLTSNMFGWLSSCCTLFLARHAYNFMWLHL